MKIQALLLVVTLVVSVFGRVGAAGGAMSRDVGDGLGGDDGGGKLPPGDHRRDTRRDSRRARRRHRDSEDEDDDEEEHGEEGEAGLPDTSVGVPPVAAVPCPSKAGYNRMIAGDTLPPWLELGPDFNADLPEPWEVPTEVDAEHVPDLVRPHTWQGRWSDFIDQWFPTLGVAGQQALMRFMILFVTPRMQMRFWWFTFEKMLEKRANLIKQRGGEDRARESWERIAEAMAREGLTEAERNAHRPKVELDLSGHWSRREQMDWANGVDRAKFEMVGSRMSGVTDLISVSDRFVRSLTGTMSSRSAAALRDENGLPINASDRSNARKSRGTRIEWDDDGQGNDEPDDNGEDGEGGDGSRKRRRVGKKGNKAGETDKTGGDHDRGSDGSAAI